MARNYKKSNAAIRRKALANCFTLRSAYAA